MKTGWVYYGNNWYYLNPVSDGYLGAMKTGWQTIDGKDYYFEATTGNNLGHMYHSQMTPDNHYVNEDGSKKE